MIKARAQEARYVDFGRHLTRLRERMGLTLEAFAKECSVALSSMQDYENGMELPQVDDIKAIARALHITTDELLDEEEIEVDCIEDEVIHKEALSKRIKVRALRNMEETINILYSSGLSPADTQTYIIAMQRICLDSIEKLLSDNPEIFFRNNKSR